MRYRAKCRDCSWKAKSDEFRDVLTGIKIHINSTGHTRTKLKKKA